MIIKADCEAKQMFFDRIQYIESRMVNCTTMDDLEGLVLKANYTNIDFNCVPGDQNGKIDYSFFWIVAEREQASIVLALRGNVYLLNDVTGKTIERL